MTRLFLRISLERLEPGDHDTNPYRPDVLVAPIRGTVPVRYSVIAGTHAYFAAVAAGADHLDVEVTLTVGR